MWRLPGRWPAVLVTLAVAVAAVVAVRTRPDVLLDDAAITLRYAARLAAGDGWTYNDGDLTNGASAPLYTMVLAAARRLGADLEVAAAVVGVVAFAACVGLVVAIAHRVAGVPAAVVAGLVLGSWLEFSTQAQSGMESGLAAALGLGVLWALLDERDGLAGALLGLALVNKLDAAALAAAVVLAVVAVRHRVPWRLLGVASLVVTPWLVWAWATFGSPLPRSLTAKLGGDVANPAWEHSLTWVLGALRSQSAIPVVVLGLASLAAVPWLAARDRQGAIVLSAAVGWALLHGAAVSVVDLGDAYSWYLTVLYPPLAVAVGCGAGVVLAAVPAPRRAVAAGVVGVVVLAALGVADGGGRPATVALAVVDDPATGQYEAFELVRREAALDLAERVRPGEVVLTCWGWPAYAALDATIAELCPLNTSRPVPAPTWYLTGTYPGTDEPEVPPGSEVVATFRSEVGEGGRVDVVRLPS